VIMWHWSTSPN